MEFRLKFVDTNKSEWGTMRLFCTTFTLQEETLIVYFGIVTINFPAWVTYAKYWAGETGTLGETNYLRLFRQIKGMAKE